ncbi:MAG: RNA polymerase factor sigma-54, partial [Candidatus Sumerlaeaceae bacterium]|nr:RNA polymerase factor sigma-54 [Candidatus Sumerlaeaceae bacterium]
AKQNPFLEIKGEIEDETAGQDGEQGAALSILEGGEVQAGPTGTEQDSDTGHFEDVDVNWDEVYDENVVPPFSRYSVRDSDEEEHDLEDYVAAPTSLFDNLRWQLQVMGAPERIKKVAEHIIGCLDEDGYLRVPLEEIAQQTNSSVEEVEEALRLVQALEPAGIGARSLAECLEIQLRQRRVDDPLAYEIVRHHLLELPKKNVKKLAKLLGADEEHVRKVVALITTLEPKPGYAFSTRAPMYIRPDVIVKRVDDDYYVFVDDGVLSELRISPTYSRLMEAENSLDAEKDRKFVREKFKAAQWLVRNLARRKNTLLRVARAIVDYQREFFDKGINFLKPLTLRQVAEAVGMHESTVARVTTGKYMETPRGTFEMKYFFSRGLQNESGEEASNRTVKQMIAELIENDDPNSPMSDQQIVEALKRKGINIARRTVAKYREQLGILPSRLRKKV